MCVAALGHSRVLETYLNQHPHLRNGPYKKKVPLVAHAQLSHSTLGDKNVLNVINLPI